MTGFTASPNFPTTPSAIDPTPNGNQDAFVTTLDATGTALVDSTYLGGSGFDQGRAIAVDAAGSVYVTGVTQSGDFPKTTGAFDPTLDGGQDAFVAKIASIGPPATLMLEPAADTNPGRV